MNWIVAKKELDKHLFQLEINAPGIAVQWQPGQYVNLKISGGSAKIPVYPIEVNPLKGSIQLYLQRKSIDGHLLSELNVGQEIYEVTGPFGHPFGAGYYGTVFIAAEAAAILPVYPLIKSLKAAGNQVIVLQSAQTIDSIFLEKKLLDCADEVVVMTDDGSKGKQGLLIHGMKELLQKVKIDKIYTIGSAHLVKYTSLLLQKHNIANHVFLFSRMGLSNGSGFIYNIAKANYSRSICVDGPEFNAYYPNFDELVQHLGNHEEDQFSGYQNYEKVLSAPEYSYMIY